MALVITVAQQKGGAGKTMLAANLAAFWAAHRRVTVLDIDPQRSLARWHGLRAALPGAAPVGLSEVSGWRLRGALERLSAAADILIVDTPPQIDSDAAGAIRAAALVLVPVQPSLPDLWACDATLQLARAERRRVAILLNRAPAKSALRARVEAELAALGLTVLAQALGDRRAYAQAFAQGMGVTEARRPGVAAAELSALAAAILEIAQ